MKTTASNPSEKAVLRTPEQEKRFLGLMEDMGRRIGRLALNKVRTDKRGWQSAIEQNDELRQVLTDAALKFLGNHSMQLQYVKSVDLVLHKSREDEVEASLTENFLGRRYKIGSIGSNFRSLFLGTKLKRLAGRRVAVHELKEDLNHQQLKGILGRQLVVSLVDALELVNWNPYGNSKADLFLGENNNLAVVELGDGREKTVWVLRFQWHRQNGYWSVEAFPFIGNVEWNVGARIVSCDPFDTTK